jgi:hypothetical protein
VQTRDFDKNCFVELCLKKLGRGTPVGPGICTCGFAFFFKGAPTKKMAEKFFIHPQSCRRILALLPLLIILKTLYPRCAEILPRSPDVV